MSIVSVEKDLASLSLALVAEFDAAIDDELNLLVHPIAVGDGMARLFPPDEPSIRLELLSAQTFKSGVLNLSYGPAKD